MAARLFLLTRWMSKTGRITRLGVATLCLSSVLAGVSEEGLANAATRHAHAGGVRVVLSRSIAHPADHLGVTVIDDSKSAIVYAPCFNLARRVHGRWVLITQTHGIPLMCPTVAFIQRAHSRRRWSIALFDDLHIGHYRVSLSYTGAPPGVARAPLMLITRQRRHDATA
jgi:hypothetical protein